MLLHSSPLWTSWPKKPGLLVLNSLIQQLVLYMVQKQDRGKSQTGFVPSYPDWKCFTSSYPIVTWEMSKRPFSSSYKSFTLSRKSLSAWCIPSRAQLHSHPLLILEQTKEPCTDNARAGFLLKEFTKYWCSTTDRGAIKVVMFATSLMISTSDRLFKFSLTLWGMEYIALMEEGSNKKCSAEQKATQRLAHQKRLKEHYACTLSHLKA